MTPQALLFDVFGTLVDWRSGLIRDFELHFKKHPCDLDPALLADAWRAEYQPSMAPIRDGSRPSTKLDVLHRENLFKIADRFGFPLGDETDIDWLVKAWHRLPAWADVPSGMAELRKQAICAAQSNGHIALSVNLARYNGYSWDAVLGAEVVGTYKPAPESYFRACDALDLPPAACMMVAAHNSDLLAAKACGLQTAFVRRATEHGPGQTIDLEAASGMDLSADSLTELAHKLRNEIR